jgi:hypothetical protein
MDPVCLIGAKEICACVGENPKQITDLVQNHNFPAWRRRGTGSWCAMPEDLKEWMRRQRDRYLTRRPLPEIKQ